MSEDKLVKTAVTNYGPIKRGVKYTILHSGLDYYVVRLKGKGLFVPRWVFFGTLDNQEDFNITLSPKEERKQQWARKKS